MEIQDRSEFKQRMKGALHLDPARTAALTVDMQREYLDESGVTLVEDLEEGLPLVSLDTNMIREVFLNIIMNAGNAMRKGRGTLRVSSWLSPRSKRSAPTSVRIAFSDTGPGIPDGRSAEIFEPFISGGAKSLGLGLSISQRICKEHGGLISAANNSEGGARFTVILPIPQSVAESRGENGARTTGERGSAGEDSRSTSGRPKQESTV